MPQILDSDGGSPNAQDLINSVQPTATQLFNFPFSLERKINQIVRQSPDTFVGGAEWIASGLFQVLSDEASCSSLRYGLCRPAIILTPPGDIFFVVSQPNVVTEGPGWPELSRTILVILRDKGLRSSLRIHLLEWKATGGQQ